MTMIYPPEYNGPGIYALIDQHGKKYIGSSRHVQDRLRTHMSNIRRVRKRGRVDGIIAEKLGLAVLAGSVFYSVVLEEIPEDATEAYIDAREKAWLEQEGGQNNTYNGRSVCRPVLTQKHHELEQVCRRLPPECIDALLCIAKKMESGLLGCQPGDLLAYVEEKPEA